MDMANNSEEENHAIAVNPLVKTNNGWAKCGWNLIYRVEDHNGLPGHLADRINIDALKNASKTIYETGLVYKTPVIDGQPLLETCKPIDKKSCGTMESFGLKLENMQCSGSFKMRGASYQFSKLSDIEGKKLITISAGNYGRSFAFLAKEMNAAHSATVFMPKTVNESRRSKIKAFGVKVDCSFPQSGLVKGVKNYQQGIPNSIFLHPFDDPDVLIGHASAGLELLEQVPSVDIVLVCCGGGGFLAGITAAFRLSGNSHTKIYGVEHELASTMFDSLEKDEIVLMKNDPSCTICPGLAAPFPGEVPFEVFRALGDGVILVSEEEIKRAMKALYKMGLVVEPSGAAAVAAVLSNKVPSAAGKKVVAFVTGGNVTPSELNAIFQ